jgi:hypothetical protein
MPQQANTTILALLLKAYNRPVKDFYYFPDVIMVGKQRMEPEDFYLLVANGYLQQTHCDSFGRFYCLSEKAKQLLHESLHARQARGRKKQPAPQAQGSFSFV